MTEFTKTVSLYTYSMGGRDYIAIYEGARDMIDCAGIHVRISEPVTITFKPRDRGEVVASQVAGIDAEIAEARDRFARKLAELQDRRNNLLALTGPDTTDGAGY